MENTSGNLDSQSVSERLKGFIISSVKNSVAGGEYLKDGPSKPENIAKIEQDEENIIKGIVSDINQFRDIPVFLEILDFIKTSRDDITLSELARERLSRILKKLEKNIV